MSSKGAIPKGTVSHKMDIKQDILKSDKVEKDPVFLDEPLDKKIMTVVEDDEEKKVGALHEGWAERFSHKNYTQPPVIRGSDPSEFNEMRVWIELTESMVENMQTLLEMSHHRFWSQVVYDPGLHTFLESFLTNCHRWYEVSDLHESARPVMEALRHLVFLVYMRMATYKESAECHITPSVFAELIYNNYLFDICVLLDLCQLYGASNASLLTSMLANIFNHQPRFYDDLKDAIPSIVSALEKIEDKLGVSDYSVPVALSHPNERLSQSELEDIVKFLLDIFSQLRMFLSLHPPAAKFFLSAGVDIKLCQFYDRVFPALVHELSEGDGASKLIKKVDLTRSLALVVFRTLLHHKCLTPLETNPTQTMVGECVENYMNAMSTLAGEKTFLPDYCTLYPLNPDLQEFEKHGGDTTMLDFVTDVVTTALRDLGVTPEPERLKRQPSPVPTHSTEAAKKSDESGMNGYGAVPNDVELASMISSVQDLLPHLGTHFIKQCLKYYSYSTEEVINALLENNLPPSLASLDPVCAVDPNAINTTPPPPSSPQPEMNDDQSKTTDDFSSHLLNRANVYNNDEFDVFSKSNVDRSKIHKGKKTQDVTQYKEDPDTVEKLKAIAHQYEERGGTSIYEDEFRYEAEEEHRPWVYDDEYDDTYDDNDAGNIDEFSADKIKRHPGIIGAGRLNAPIQYNNSQDSSEEKSDGEEEGETQEGSESKDTTGTSQNQNRQQQSVRPKQKSSTRGVQRMFTKKSSKPKQPTPEQDAGPTPSAPSENGPQADQAPTPSQPRPEMRPFCENPEFVRQRAEQRRQDRDAFRNRGPRWQREGWRGGESSHVSNGSDDRRPRVSYSSTKHSGKSWRHGDGDGGGGGDEGRGYRGGKYKEDTNHGHAQSRQYRNKMIHKNDHKRQGAQAKFNRNN